MNQPEPSRAVYLAHRAVRLPLSLIGVATIFVLRGHPRIMRPFPKGRYSKNQKCGPPYARVGILRALNHGKPRVFSDRKETRWGKRKLKRDE